MKIAVVDLVSLAGGGRTISQSLYDHISAGNARQHQWLFIISDQQLEPSPFVEVVRFPGAAANYARRLKTELVDVAKAVRDFGADRVLAMSNMKVFGCPVPQIVYLQQSLPFHTEDRFSLFKKRERLYFFHQTVHGWFIRRSARTADRVYTQSDWVRDEVKKLRRKGPVENLSYPRLKLPEVRTERETASETFFYPCSSPAVYKNLKTLNRAAKLLLAQGLRPQISLTLEETAMVASLEEPLAEGVYTFTGRIPHEEVMDRYCNTTLLFPSYLESLGLPLVEARGCGSFVIAADRPFAREMLQGYDNCALFDPHDPAALAEEMKKIMAGTVALRPDADEDKPRKDCWQRLTELLDQLEL